MLIIDFTGHWPIKLVTKGKAMPLLLMFPLLTMLCATNCGDLIENHCKNPGFELLDPAGNNFPLNWVAGTGGKALVRIDADTHGGGVAVRMMACPGGRATLRSDRIDVRRGVATFFYKVISAENPADSLHMAVVAVSAGKTEIERVGFAVPAEQAKTPGWQQAKIAFDFLGKTAVSDIYLLLAVEGEHSSGGEWLVDDFAVEQRAVGPRLAIETLYMPEPILVTGQPSDLVVQVANVGDAVLPKSDLNLELPKGIRLAGDLPATIHVESLEPRRSRRYTWSVVGDAQAEYDLTATWKMPDAVAAGGVAKADGQQPGNGAIAYANDGDETTYWYAGEDRNNGKLWIDFNRPQRVREISFLAWATSRHAPKDYSVGVTMPDGSRREIASVHEETRMGQWIAFPCDLADAAGIWLDVRSTIEGKYGPVVYEFRASAAPREGGPLQIVSASGSTGLTTKSRHVVCVDKKEPRSLCRRSDGFWRFMPAPLPLQRGSTVALTPLTPMKSSQLPDSYIGVTSHVPRSSDIETIFEPEHLIDGNPETSWSGRAHATAVPGAVDWVQVDFASAADVRAIHLVPYWKAEGFPVDFRVKLRTAGQWRVVHEATGLRLEDAAGEDAKTPYVIPVEPPVRAESLRLEVTRFRPASAFFTDCAVTNYFRLSEIEAINTAGENVALASKGAKVSVPWTFRSYFSRCDVIRDTFADLYELGVKWNRIGQWGDRTCWAAVEQKKGEYVMDPVTDQAITESVRNGINILFTLDYGNPLYEETPWLTNPGPVWRHGHPFTGDGGPTTPEAIQGFVNYARFIGEHFKGRVKYYEIWNEENSWAWYGSPPDPRAFGKLIRDTAKALKEIDPSIRVITGGTAALAPTFLSEALEQGGGPYLDGIAFHPYTMPYPEKGLGTLDVVGGKQAGKPKEELGYDTYEEMIGFLHKIFDRFNPKFELWADEWNAIPTSEDSPYAGCSELVEAKQAARFFLVNTLNDVYAVWWSLASQNTLYDWGVLRTEDLSRKPIFYTLQAMTTLLSGAKADRNVHVTVEEGKVPGLRCEALRGRDGETMVALWTATNPVDECAPSYASIKIDVAGVKNVEAVDTLHAMVQPVTFQVEDKNVRVNDLLVVDYPVVLRIR